MSCSPNESHAELSEILLAALVFRHQPVEGPVEFYPMFALLQVHEFVQCCEINDLISIDPHPQQQGHQGLAGTAPRRWVLAIAILDRVLRHSHVLNIKGRSYRLCDLEKAISLRQ